MNEMDRLASMINPDVCVISSIGYSHLEGLQNLETVAEEKNQTLATFERQLPRGFS